MNPQMSSGNPAMSQAVQEALARRGMATGGAPQLNQVSPDAAMQNPVAQPQAPSDMGMGGGGMTGGGGMPQQGMTQGQPKPKFEPTNQEDFIISTLSEQLKRSHDLKKEQMKMSNPISQPSIGQPIQSPSQPMM